MIQRRIEGCDVPHGYWKIQGRSDWAGAMVWAYGIDALPGGPGQRPLTLGTELPYECGAGKSGEGSEGTDSQAFQALDHDRSYRKCPHWTLGEKVRQLSFGDDDRGPGACGSCSHPGTELPESPASSGRRDQRAWKDPEQCCKAAIQLVRWGAVQTSQAIHSHEDPSTTVRLDDGAQVGQGVQHLLLCSVVMGRVGLQESQGGAEGYGLGYEMSWPHAGDGGSFGKLPDGTTGAFARGEKGYGGGVETRVAHQLQAELEGGKPEADGGTAPAVGGGCVFGLPPTNVKVGGITIGMRPGFGHGLLGRRKPNKYRNRRYAEY